MPDPRVDVSEELRHIAQHGDALAGWQRSLIGRAARLHLPLHDPVDLRRLAPVLRTLASALEVLSQDGKRPAWEVLFDARRRIEIASKIMQKGK